jgi:hypothetical protein
MSLGVWNQESVAVVFRLKIFFRLGVAFNFKVEN